MFRSCISSIILYVFLTDLILVSSITQNVLEFENSEKILEAINDSINYRIQNLKGKDEKPWFSSRDTALSYCVRPGKCEKLEYNMCFNAKIPYSYTSLDLTYSVSQQQSWDQLQQYQTLIHIPKCWAVIQPFLCATYFPKCENISNTEIVYIPSLEMCKIIMEPCRLVYNTTFFPDFLKCNPSLYSSSCKNDVRDMKFNITGQCLPPLVKTDSIKHFYDGIDGCGLQCNDALYTVNEHQQIHKLIAWGATICLLCNMFTILTFLIDWQNANKYPALVIFYINCWFLISCLGFIAQFIPGAREDIVCRKDGTLRQSEPSAGENLSCVVVFVVVYYSLIAAMVWFVIFTYVWHISFQAIGKIQERIDKKGAYFHLIACSLPLVLTITTMALSEIDGNSIVGICFLGYKNHSIRAGLLLGPICGVIIVGGYFLSRGFLTLITLKITSKDIISARASKKIRETIARMGLCCLLMVVLIIGTFSCHINEFQSTQAWASDLKNYIICLIMYKYDTSNSAESCRLTSRPSVALLQLHLLCWFATGIIMSSWVWTKSSAEAWKRYIRKKFDCEIEEPLKLQKHKVIAQAFAKRKEFHDAGRLSITFHNTHTDPLGLNFELNSVASHDFSSTWANNLPRFVNRRCALTCGPNTGSASSSHCGNHRRNSLDSEISFSVRHVSVESRRNSLDSQISFKIAEMKTKVASRRCSKGKRIRKRDFFSKRSNRNSSVVMRRESSTSLETQIGAQIIKVLNADHNSRPSLKRRTGNAGLDSDNINSLLCDGKLVLPFLHNQGLTTSDDECHSVTSLTIKDSRLDVVLRRKSHISSDDNLNQVSINIEEYHSSDDKCSPNNYEKSDPANEKCIMSSSHKDRKEKEGKITKSTSKYIRNKKLINLRKNRKSLNDKVSRSNKPIESESGADHDLCESRAPKSIKKSSSISSSDSYCSELSPLAVQSSFSGISVGKTNSRNSKLSCDVGIQANAHEIATQTMSSYERNNGSHTEIIYKSVEDLHGSLEIISKDEASKYSHTKKSNNRKNSVNVESESECTHLLLPSTKPVIVQKKKHDTISNIGQSETDKLKLLLLPAK